MGLIEIKPEFSERESRAMQNCNNAYLAQRLPIGTVLTWPSGAAPAGSLLLQGQLVSRATYPDLWSFAQNSGNMVPDTNWSAGRRGGFSAGDGSTTFRLPDFKGAAPVGKDSGQAEFDTLGETGGAKTHTLTEAQMPIHAHNITSASSANEGAINTNQLAIGKEGTTYANKNPIETAGGGLAHNNLQPYVVTNYIIIALLEVTHGDIETALADLIVDTQAAGDNANTAAAEVRAVMVDINAVDGVVKGDGAGNYTAAVKADIELGNVDNTADIDKPVSTKQQTALDLKANTEDVNTALANKADKAVTYTKTETDTELALKADKTALTETNLKIAILDKAISDYQNAISGINANQEAKQTASGYGTVSLPVNAANGQISDVRIFGNSVVDEVTGEVNSTVSAGRLRATGANLFDNNQAYSISLITKILNGYNIKTISSWGTGYLDYPDLPSGAYTMSADYLQKGVATTIALDIRAYKNSTSSYNIKTAISASGRVTVNFTIPQGVNGFRLYFYSNLTANTLNADCDFTNIMLRTGTLTPLSYEPYTYTTQYYPDCGILQSVGTANDEVRVSGGKAEKVQRNNKKIIQSNDVINLTSLTNIDFVKIAKPADCVELKVSISGQTILEGSREVDWVGYDNVANIGCYVNNIGSQTFQYIVAKGTTLTQVREQLTGLALTYQLASPIVTPINVTGTLIGYPNGTVYWEPVLPVAGLYTSAGIAITNTSFPIESLESISKIDFVTGVETPIDISKAVINADGLSFTHPDLIDGDIVFFTYYHSVTGTQPEITTEYYDSRYVLKDSVTGKFYKVVETVANGILTRTLVEV